jgi:glycosyltransferase involved in cell wall biosynthesis
VARGYLTAPEQLADLFEKNNISVIKTAYSQNKIFRLIHIVKTIFKKKARFHLAIIPLYGTAAAFYLQAITSRILKLLHKQIIMTVHGGSIPQRMQKDPARFLRSLKRADQIVAPSGFLQNELSRYNIQSTVIQNPIPIKDYPFILKNEFRPKLLWMRTFEDLYNPFMAIDVAVILSGKYGDFEMVMAGADKGLLDPAKKYVQKKGIAAKVHFPGFISLGQKLEYARHYDFCISTNHIDNAPVSLVECMALGLVVISVNTGGLPYMIENNCNGFLVNPGDAAGMAYKIMELIEKPGHAHRVAQQARLYAEQFDESIVIKKWKQLLKKEFNFN